jgi:two-component system, response regulator PdtaR
MSSIESPGAAPKKILIVEDEFILALTTQRELEKLGYHVVGVAGSRQAALDAVEKHRPDIMLMDIQLRGQPDGIAITSEIQALYDTPVIYVTGNSDDLARRRTASTRVAGFLAKPLLTAELAACLRAAFAAPVPEDGTAP